MSNLIAKIMSREPLLDSDPRKTFKLIPVPEDHEVEFQRTEIANVVNMLFTALYGNSRGSLIPLQDCGKVYILQDGKTVSSFDPEPKPAPQFNVQGEIAIKSETLEVHGDSITLRGGATTTVNRLTMDLASTEAYQVLKDDLDFLAPSSIYPWAERWNDTIAKHVIYGHHEVKLSLMLGEEVVRDARAVNRYFARVRDALLNLKDMVLFTWSQVDDGNTWYLARFGETPPVIQHLTMTQTSKQNLLDNDVNGMVINNVQRAIKLLNYGASEVLMTPKLRINENEMAIIKKLFRDAYRYNVKFHFAGDLLVSMSFDVITQTGPAL